MGLGETFTGNNLKRTGSQKPVYTQVVEHIQQLIRRGDLTPGDQLLPERELAEKLGVSRTSVRQALATLEGKGVIEIAPRDGAWVKKQSLEDALASLIEVLFQEREQVTHLFEVRQIIETQATSLAAKRRTGADIQRLRALNRQFELGLTQGDIAFQANTDFHIGIVETAKNPLLNQIMCTLLTATIEVYEKARKQSLSSSGNLFRFVAEHEAIINAIDQQDPDLAASLLAKHINDARQRVETIIIENQPTKGA